MKLCDYFTEFNSGNIRNTFRTNVETYYLYAFLEMLHRVYITGFDRSLAVDANLAPKNENIFFFILPCVARHGVWS